MQVPSTIFFIIQHFFVRNKKNGDIEMIQYHSQTEHCIKKISILY